MKNGYFKNCFIARLHLYDDDGDTRPYLLLLFLLLLLQCSIKTFAAIATRGDSSVRLDIYVDWNLYCWLDKIWWATTYLTASQGRKLRSLSALLSKDRPPWTARKHVTDLLPKIPSLIVVVVVVVVVVVKSNDSKANSFYSSLDSILFYSILALSCAGQSVPFFVWEPTQLVIVSIVFDDEEERKKTGVLDVIPSPGRP